MNSVIQNIKKRNGEIVSSDLYKGFVDRGDDFIHIKRHYFSISLFDVLYDAVHVVIKLSVINIMYL